MKLEEKTFTKNVETGSSENKTDTGYNPLKDEEV